MAMIREAGGERNEIAFFDLETTRPGQGRAILEFGAILVCPRKLEEKWSYSTLVRPSNPSLISSLRDRCNGINPDAIASAPYFSDIADTVFDILHGRIWAGHNIAIFDCARIREAFAEIGKEPPEAKWIIDSLDLLTQRFGKRAGNMKMATLATYFGLGEQTHRSLADVRMNLEVLKRCATVLFLESSLLPEGFSRCTEFVLLDDVSMASISVTQVPTFHGSPRIELLHEDVPLQLNCPLLEVRLGVKCFDSAGRPKLSFVVNARSSLCKVLDACDDAAQKLYAKSGCSSHWRHVVRREDGFANYPTTRLNIPTIINGEIAQYGTEIYQSEASGSMRKLVFNKFDAAELGNLIVPGTFMDVYLSLDPYNYPQNAGIRLVAKKIVIHK